MNPDLLRDMQQRFDEQWPDEPETLTPYEARKRLVQGDWPDPREES